MSYMFQTSPSLHEQRTKLERAQMGDRLRQKIASRPDRQELVHRHILEVSMGDGQHKLLSIFYCTVKPELGRGPHYI